MSIKWPLNQYKATASCPPGIIIMFIIHIRHFSEVRCHYQMTTNFFHRNTITRADWLWTLPSWDVTNWITGSIKRSFNQWPPSNYCRSSFHKWRLAIHQPELRDVVYLTILTTIICVICEIANEWNIISSVCVCVCIVKL